MNNKLNIRKGDLVYLNGILNTDGSDEYDKPIKVLIINVLKSKHTIIDYLQEDMSIKNIRSCSISYLVGVDNNIDNLMFENLKLRMKIVNSQIPEVGKTAIFKKFGVIANLTSHNLNIGDKFKIVEVIDRSIPEPDEYFDDIGINEPMNSLLLLRPTKHWNHNNEFYMDSGAFYIS